MKITRQSNKVVVLVVVIDFTLNGVTFTDILQYSYLYGNIKMKFGTIVIRIAKKS